MYTPKRNKPSSNSDSETVVTPSNKILKASSYNNGDKAFENGSPSLGEKTVISPGEARRGRPRADLLNSLILEGATSPSSIKCTYCNRVFPREKSLQAHLRTHTGEKPYACDYPRCTRKFAQSGQLKTHQRLHTGEKPFICAAPNCTKKFTHSNRHCPDHPEYTLKRFITKPKLTLDKTYDETHSAEVRQWLQNYDRKNKNFLKSNENLDTTPKKSIVFKNEDSVFSSGSSAYYSGCSQTGLDDMENSPKSELEDLETSTCSNSGGSENEMCAESPQTKPSELPKKRWLREATQDQRLWDSSTDLASPLNWGDDSCNDGEENKMSDVNDTENKNQQQRPSVLVCVQGGKSKEISSDEIQGAMALVELKNGLNYSYRI
ncbi:pair-rule protein odd-paired-like [Sitophilus oryzae]|uniref:Pair-rule protein odd-paired-like n=1 Tax=Sitophilus oryzae TaxID=7048 RepID=A0A6J2XYM4_SITOR|nr:pair-rule protein odd-paired-like [Sitophilus oryzae]